MLLIGIGDIGWLNILITGILFFLSAWVAAAEEAFFWLSTAQHQNLKRQYPAAYDTLTPLLQNENMLWATLYTLRTLTNVSVITLSYALFNSWLAGAQLLLQIAGLVIYLAIWIIFAEGLPRLFAAQHTLSVVAQSATLLHRSQMLLFVAVRPLAALYNYIDQQSTKFFSPTPISSTDIDHAIDIVAHAEQQNLDPPELGTAASAHTTPKEQIRILRGLIKLHDSTVRQIMCQRSNIFAIDSHTPFDQLCQKVIDNAYSRVPVYQDDLDHVIGILYIKDLLEYISQPTTSLDWQKLLKKEVFFVPETKRIDELFQEMKAKQTHVALAVDEYGSVVGLITLEDILEEIVGDINDEYDDPNEEIYFKRINSRVYIFNAKTLLDDVCRLMQVSPTALNSHHSTAESLGGLLLDLSPKFPTKGTVINHNDVEFKILSVQNNRLGNIKITLPNLSNLPPISSS